MSARGHRRLWRCPTCGARGWEDTAHAAYVAGCAHWEQEHRPFFDDDGPRNSPGQFLSPRGSDQGPNTTE